MSLLHPADYTNLRFTCVQINKAPLVDYKKLIIQKLRLHRDDPETFVANLVKYNAVLSGPFMSSCVYGSSYNQVDVFGYVDAKDQIYENTAGNFDLWYWHTAEAENSFCYYLRNVLADRKDWEISCSYLHAMRRYGNCTHICTPVDPMDYIRNHVDFDQYKVAFDGNKLYIRK
jgi:hypothetical protein